MPTTKVKLGDTAGKLSMAEQARFEALGCGGVVKVRLSKPLSRPLSKPLSGPTSRPHLGPI